jgi:hypothetical protein
MSEPHKPFFTVNLPIKKEDLYQQLKQKLDQEFPGDTIHPDAETNKLDVDKS